MFVYFTLAGYCGAKIVYFTLGGSCGPVTKLLLFSSDFSFAFLEQTLLGFFFWPHYLKIGHSQGPTKFL